MTMFGLTPKEEAAVLSGPKRIATAFRMLTFIASRPEGATCDECEEALDLPHQSASPRYNELVHCGCLVPSAKRRTKAGGLAISHKVAENASFGAYLARSGKKTASKGGLNEKEQAVLAAGLKFLARWKRATTKKARADAAVALVDQLSPLA